MYARASLALVSLLVAGCGGGYSSSSTTDAAPVGFLGARWSATLTSPPGAPGTLVSGTGTVMGNADSTQTRVEVSLAGAAPEGRHPWHLHRGTCGNDQGVVGEASSYAPLTVGTDGRARGVATIGMAMPRTGEYMINVHASPTELGTIVACGNLTGPSGS